MAGSHCNNSDIRPKRRKSKDNPYTLQSYGINTGCPHYSVSFRDGGGVLHTEEISKELFELFDQFELDDLSELNEKNRHYEQSELTEETLQLRATAPQPATEDIILQEMDHQRIREAIANLSDVQRRRLQMYYFDEMTLEDIAASEGCKYQQVQKSIEGAKKKIKIFLKNF